MSKFTIVESVGNRIEPIKKYDDIEKHHPSSGKEKGRQYETLHGKLEEVAKSNGQLHVKKDFILSENGSSNVNVPSPVAGYAYYDKNYGTVAVYDKPKTGGGKLTAKLHHIKPGTLTFENGGRVEYGQGLGQQYGTGKNGRKTYGIHSHVETDEATFRKYIDDIVSGKIIPSSAGVKKQESKRGQNKSEGGGGGEVESWTLGQTSKRFESSKGGAGTISTGKGDKGGVSYGAYQFSSKEGAVQEFLKKTKYGKVFSGLEPATNGFNKKWKEVAASDPEFYAAQYNFIKNKYYEKQLDRLKKQGVDVSGRGRAVQDMVWSTATQFRNNTTSIFKNALKGQDVSKMSDAQIISAVQDYKAEKNESLFRNSSSDVRKGTLNRAKQEKEALLKLAATRPKSDAEKINKEQEAVKQKAEQIKAQEAAKQKAEQIKEQEAAKQKAEQIKAQEAAKQKAEQIKVQEAAKQKAEQIKAQEAAKQKAEQIKAQEAAKQKAEQIKVQEAAKQKAEQIKAQEAAKQKAEQIKVQEAAKQKAEQIKAQEAAKQKAAQAKTNEAAKSKAIPGTTSTPKSEIEPPEAGAVASANSGGTDAAQLQAILSALQATLSQLSSMLSQPIQITVDVQNGNIVAAVNAANSQQQRRS